MTQSATQGKSLNIRFWVRITLFNLLLVAAAGTLMRYKIGFSFPYFSQKNLQHAHSHFAFIGWITQLLFVMMTNSMFRDRPSLPLHRYKRLLVANLVCAYCMLISFAASGYSVVSITLSCASIFIAFIYAFTAFRDLRKLETAPYRNWFTAGLWFNIISSLGTFTLGYMMATHNFDQHIHLGALYFYLHFQYNGFFMFVCMGLLFTAISRGHGSFRQDPAVFWIFFLACVPAYFLSVLWGKLPVWVFVLMALAAVAQVYGWIRLLKWLNRERAFFSSFNKLSRLVLMLVAASMTAKLLLQLGSTIPALSKLAFGFRPVVIAYLHLILLAIITVFLLIFLYVRGYLSRSAITEPALALFVCGVYLNEIVLGAQGIVSFSYNIIPYVNEALFGIAVLILLSLILLFAGEMKGSPQRIVSGTPPVQS